MNNTKEPRLGVALYRLVSVFQLFAILTAPQREAVRQWWIGGLWVNHSDKGWVHAHWNPGATSCCAKCGRAQNPEWIIDDTGGHYHRTLCTITEIRDFTANTKMSRAVGVGSIVLFASFFSL